MWFEGDQLLYGELVRPTNIDRGTLKFKRDYALSPGQAIKVYDLKWNVGAPDIVAFLADRELFGGKFIGSKFNFDYAMRCNNEDQIIGSTEEILRLMGL